MFPTNLSGLARASVAIGLSSLIFLAAFTSHSEHKTAREYQSEVDAVAVIAPSSKPKPSQASIDLALVMYGINVPRSALHPQYDAKLGDRGLTTRGAFMEKAEVTIGDAAFTSWALLGSTLAHELEIHCNQNFFFIYVMDVLGMDGTGEAERQAYAHELSHSKRFGLKHHDAHLIADTVAYYYPTEAHAKHEELSSPFSIESWLAKNLLNDAGNL